MRFTCIISLFAAAITILYAAPTLTSDQDLVIDNIAWLYAQFTLTFNLDHLPLDNYYRSPDGQQHFEQYEEVEKFFSTKNLDDYFFQSTGIHVRDWTPEFEQRIKRYQSIIINEDSTPLQFEAFYNFFNAIKDEFSHNIINKISVDRLIMNDRIFKNFCSHPNSDQQIIEGLNNYEIYGRFPTNPTNKELEALHKYDKRFNTFLTDLKGSRQPKPNKWTYHHIIPSHVLTTFFNHYFTIFAAKSQQMQKTHNFNWLKIMEINTQKSLLTLAKKLWGINPEATLPVNDFKKKPDGQQEDFVRTCYRWPPGLIFFGPTDRSEDPGSELEVNAKHIIGTPYFNLVEQLYMELITFNTNFNPESEAQNQEAMRLHKKILTIHEEYGLPIYVFPFNTDQWLLAIALKNKKEIQSWKINTAFNSDLFVYSIKLDSWLDMADQSSDSSSVERFQVKNEWRDWKTWQVKRDKVEWREKQLAQEEYNRREMFRELPMDLNLLPTPNFDLLLNPTIRFIGAEGSRGPVFKHWSDELKRRKRHHTADPSTYISEMRDKCETLNTPTTTESVIKVHPKTDSCGYYLNTGTPSILAVPYWGLCKLFG